MAKKPDPSPSKSWTTEERPDGWWCYGSLGEPHGPFDSEEATDACLEDMDRDYDLNILEDA